MAMRERHLGAAQRVFGVAAVSQGIADLGWRDFATYWQPVPEGFPAHALLVVLAGLTFIAGGTALQFRRSARAGALALAILYSMFMLLWARRIVGYPQIVATWGGTAEQLALVSGALLIYLGDRRGVCIGQQPAAIRAPQVAFGLCAVAFGANHFANLKLTAAMVPAWLPPDQMFWAIGTGVAHVLVGVAIVARIQDQAAARLATIMYAMFGVLVWIPNFLAAPTSQISWAGNAINLALVGAAWVVADSLLGDRGKMSGISPLAGETTLVS